VASLNGRPNLMGLLRLFLYVQIYSFVFFSRFPSNTEDWLTFFFGIVEVGGWVTDWGGEFSLFFSCFKIYVLASVWKVAYRDGLWLHVSLGEVIAAPPPPPFSSFPFLQSALVGWFWHFWQRLLFNLHAKFCFYDRNFRCLLGSSFFFSFPFPLFRQASHSWRFLPLTVRGLLDRTGHFF